MAQRINNAADASLNVADLVADLAELFSKEAYATTGIGYPAGVGAGSTVTQLTSKSTDVTLNKLTGKILMHNASLAAGATVTFVLLNSTWAANDTIVLHVSNVSVGAASAYQVWPWGGGGSSGAVGIALKNVSAGALAEVVTITFAIIKGSVT